jgi:hypothetical protein
MELDEPVDWIHKQFVEGKFDRNIPSFTIKESDWERLVQEARQAVEQRRRQKNDQLPPDSAIAAPATS